MVKLLQAETQYGMTTVDFQLHMKLHSPVQYPEGCMSIYQPTSLGMKMLH